MHTKELILNTAKEMISQVGYHRTTTANLAKMANISEGTIYRHFESKEEILLSILRELDENYVRFIEHVREQAREKEFLTIENVLEAHTRFVADNAADIKIVLSTYGILESSKKSMAAFIRRMQDFFEDCLESAVAHELIREVDVKGTAMTLVTVLFGLMRVKLYWEGEFPDFTDEAIRFCRRSLAKNPE